jgi:hypothetical protein
MQRVILPLQVTGIAAPDYIPTIEDIIKTRVRTAGILGA